MDLRRIAFELAHTHALDRSTSQKLLALAIPPGAPPLAWAWLWRGVAVLAAALGGLGIVMWVAANWDDFGRMGRFAILQACAAAALLGTATVQPLRAPLGLLGMLGIGALFAYFGQTYQTGADPWQLFALWAALALPLCLAVRSEVTWLPWTIVATTGITLWMQAWGGHGWRIAHDDLPVHLAGWAAMGLLTGLMASPWLRARGAGVWSWRLVATLFTVMVTTTALVGLFDRTPGLQYMAGLLVMLGWGAWMCSRRGFEVYGLSAAALSLNTLLLCGLGWLLFAQGAVDPFGGMLLMGLASAALLAATVQVILHLVRRRAQGEAAADGTPAGAGVEGVAGVSPGTGDVRSATRGDATQPGSPGTAPGAAAFVHAARSEGLLPPEADAPRGDGRPWPVVLLTALGAWLSAIPLLGVIGSLLGGLLFEQGAGAYVAGVLFLALALVLLRAQGVSVFVEQLAVPLLFAGAAALGFGLFSDLPYPFAAACLCVLAVACAAAVPRPWLRTVLGAAAAALGMVALVPEPAGFGHAPAFALAFWFAPHAALAVWLGSLAWQDHRLGAPRGARDALLLEHLGAGWLPAVAAALAWQSGATFLLGGGSIGIAHDAIGMLARAGEGPELVRGVTAAVSVLLTLAAALRASRAWPVLCQAPAAGVVLVLAALSAVLPSLGAVLLALATTATTRRWRLAAACGTSLAWILGSSYYQLALPLAQKAVVLVACAALLAALAWWAHRRGGPALPARARRPALPWRQSGVVLVAATALATLAVANIGIRQKERMIALGLPVFVPLAPVDPRSLMQGDYMRLRFALPEDAHVDNDALRFAARPFAVARRDARGVATLVRMATAGTPLAPGELAIELTPKDGGWILVSDAWYFREGEARRFEQARFGEFRVAEDGSALLVGMADAQLQRIAP